MCDRSVQGQRAADCTALPRSQGFLTISVDRPRPKDLSLLIFVDPRDMVRNSVHDWAKEDTVVTSTNSRLRTGCAVSQNLLTGIIRFHVRNHITYILSQHLVLIRVIYGFINEEPFCLLLSQRKTRPVCCSCSLSYLKAT